jgi:hypothetical protein
VFGTGVIATLLFKRSESWKLSIHPPRQHVYAPRRRIILDPLSDAGHDLAVGGIVDENAVRTGGANSAWAWRCADARVGLRERPA